MTVSPTAVLEVLADAETVAVAVTVSRTVSVDAVSYTVDAGAVAYTVDAEAVKYIVDAEAVS